MEDDSQSLADVAQDHILRVLRHCNGNKTAAAKVLGLARSTLVLKIKGFGAPKPVKIPIGPEVP
jgi:DNA-binding protein Fis